MVAGEQKFLLSMKIIHSFLGIALLMAIFSCTSDNNESAIHDDTVIVPEEHLEQMNENINSLSILSKTLHYNIAAKEVSQTDNDVKIVFTNGDEITLSLGTTNSTVPFIGIEKWKGSYCWTLTFGNTKSYLTDEKGDKILVDEHVVPRLKASDGYWSVSYDKGVSYQLLTDKNGNHIKVTNNADNYIPSIKSMTNNDCIITLTFIDDTELKLAIIKEDSLNLLINGFAAIESSNSLTVNSILNSEPLSENGFSVEVLNNSIPQLIYITDNTDNILMMTRGYFQNKSMEINAETTAQAFLTMILPVFCENEETFNEVISTLKGCPSYPSIVTEMEHLINAGKAIFNPENQALFTSVNKLVDELFQSTQTRSVIDGIKKEHLDVQAEGTNVAIRNSGLKPPYGCTVSYGDKVIQETLIPSPTSIGFWNILTFEAFNHYGRTIDFNLNKEGSYTFFFDKKAKEALGSFTLYLFSDFIGIVGATIDFKEMEKIIKPTVWEEIKNGFSEFALTNLGAMASGSIPPEEVGRDLIRFGVDLILNVFENKKIATNFCIPLKAILLVNDATKSILNFTARLTQWFMAEPEINFHLCQYDNKVTSCIETKLEIIDGDNQTAISGETLKKPLIVQAKMTADDGSNLLSDYHVIKFQVQSGGGYVGNRNVKNVEIDPLTGMASIDWSLGKSGEQKVRAVIYHRITDEEVSEPVYFKATLSNKVITGGATNITTNSVSLSGNVIGYDMIGTDKYGVSVSTEASMKDAKFISAYNHTDGQFTVNVSKLTPGKTYYWRAYVKDNNSYIYGDIKTFTTQKEEAPETPSEYLGENFTLKLSSIQKVPQTTNTYRICFYISDLDLKEDAIPYLECTCAPEGYTHYAQTKTASFKENGEINIVFENLYAGTNILSFGVLIKGPTNDIRQEIGTRNFHVNYRILKDVGITYMGDEISSTKWKASYKVIYIFEDNPLTTTSIAAYDGHLSISGLTSYESTATDTETCTIKIPEDQYDIDWNNYQAKLKSGKVVFSYYEPDLYGYIYGQDNIEEKSTAFDYNQFPSIEITGLNTHTAQNGKLTDWGTGGFMGSSRGTQNFYWNCTGRLFL